MRGTLRESLLPLPTRGHTHGIYLTSTSLMRPIKHKGTERCLRLRKQEEMLLIHSRSDHHVVAMDIVSFH